MTVVDAPPADLNRVLEDLVRRVPEARHAIMLSADGLLMAASADLDRDTGENLSAVVAGLQALADAAGRQAGAGRVRQTIVEMETALLFVTASSRGGVLAVLLEGAADSASSIAYEMARLAEGVDGWVVVPPAASVAGRAEGSLGAHHRSRLQGDPPPASRRDGSADRWAP